jgi:hypothetical protein
MSLVSWHQNASRAAMRSGRMMSQATCKNLAINPSGLGALPSKKRVPVCLEEENSNKKFVDSMLTTRKTIYGNTYDFFIVSVNNYNRHQK